MPGESSVTKEVAVSSNERPAGVVKSPKCVEAALRRAPSSTTGASDVT
jgi:hypothetical protein